MKRSLIVFAVVSFLVGCAITYAGMISQNKGSVEIWLVVDGTAIGTIEPGTFEYDLSAGVISMDTNELVYGCSHDRIFRDRYETEP